MRIDIFILLLVAAIFLYRWYRKAPAAKVEDAESPPTEMIQDPNCNIYVPATEAVKATIDGRTYCFCSGKCADEYRNKHSAV
jgi:YHS domain-containing protein